MSWFDTLVKEPLFDCQHCGQCLLSQTGYVCPMTCPKGLRNGPCGGTMDGRCEVLPDRPCVWLKIRERSEPPDGVHRPVNPELVGSSSLTNFLLGRDRDSRHPKTFETRDSENVERPSVLARKFDQDSPVITYEIASPKDRSGLARVEKMVRTVQHCVDGINTTTNAGGVPSLHSLETARTVAANGVAPIVQFCGRDQGTDEFLRQAQEALKDGFANILALTGDWNPNTPRELDAGRWFPMDSLQMVDVLAAQSNFIKQPFIGVASTAYMTPMGASVRRLLAKLRAGANFTQTQVVTESELFSRWLSTVRATAEGRRCRILASVPLVGKVRPYAILRRLPGVHIDPAFAARLEAGASGKVDMAGVGLATARDLIVRLLSLDIDGIHLMNFGVSGDAVVDLIEEIRGLQIQPAA